jgi:hypothetical protein
MTKWSIKSRWPFLVLWSHSSKLIDVRQDMLAGGCCLPTELTEGPNHHEEDQKDWWYACWNYTCCVVTGQSPSHIPMVRLNQEPRFPLQEQWERAEGWTCESLVDLVLCLKREVTWFWLCSKRTESREGKNFWHQPVPADGWRCCLVSVPAPLQKDRNTNHLDKGRTGTKASPAGVVKVKINEGKGRSRVERILRHSTRAKNCNRFGS